MLAAVGIVLLLPHLMNRLLHLYIGFVIVTVGLAEQPPSDHPSADQKEVLAALDELNEAGLKRDVSALDQLYSDEYFHTNPDGSLMTKAQVLQSYKVPAKGKIDCSRHDQDKVWMRDAFAFVNTRLTISGSLNDQAYAREWRITYVFAKLNGRWRALTSHATLILPKS